MSAFSINIFYLGFYPITWWRCTLARRPRAWRKRCVPQRTAKRLRSASR